VPFEEWLLAKVRVQMRLNSIDALGARNCDLTLRTYQRAKAIAIDQDRAKAIRDMTTGLSEDPPEDPAGEDPPEDPAGEDPPGELPPG
jgi:hypothetical protein